MVLCAPEPSVPTTWNLPIRKSLMSRSSAQGARVAHDTAPAAPAQKRKPMASADGVEGLAHRYGREIFARLDRPGPVPFGPSWWDERLMEWTMGDEAVKLQLFRFVDVLPMLHEPAAIT